MQKQIESETNGTSTQHPAIGVAAVAEKAYQTVQAGASKAAAGTEKVVRRYPLAAIGLALGGGVAAGALGYRWLTPRKPTLLERLGIASLMASAIRGVGKFF